MREVPEPRSTQSVLLVGTIQTQLLITDDQSKSSTGMTGVTDLLR